MATLAEFDLLRNARLDIRRLPWTQPHHREAMNLYFGIKRAKEEIMRLNVEIRRLITFMIDEHVDYQAAADAIQQSDRAIPHLSSSVKAHPPRSGSPKHRRRLNVDSSANANDRSTGTASSNDLQLPATELEPA